MLRALLIGSCLLLPSLALGQAGKAKPAEINITEGDLIEGRGTGPGGSIVEVRDGAQFNALIHVRQDFKDKVVASVSEL